MIQHEKRKRFNLLINSRAFSVLVVFSAGIFIFGMLSIFMPLPAISGKCTISKGPFLQLIGDRRGLLVWDSCVLDAKSSITIENEVNRTIEGHYFSWGDDKKDKMLFKAEILIPQNKDELRVSIGKKEVGFSIDISALNGKRKFRAVIVGDNQKGFSHFWLLASKMGLLKPNLLIHVGDMVQNPFFEYEWKRYFFDPLEATGLIPKVPIIVAQGNHDIYGYNAIAPFFSAEDLHDEATGYYYAQTVGPLRIIVLDSNISDRDQIEWLKKELTSVAAKEDSFRIVCVHVPPFIEYWEPVSWRKGEHTWPFYIRNNMVRLFEEGKVDLVLSGHQHNYQRGSHKGVTYVVTGGGGGPLDKHKVEDFDYIYEKTILQHHFLEMNVDEDTLQIRMHQIDGAIGDEFTIVRR